MLMDSGRPFGRHVESNHGVVARQPGDSSGPRRPTGASRPASRMEGVQRAYVDETDDGRSARVLQGVLQPSGRRRPGGSASQRRRNVRNTAKLGRGRTAPSGRRLAGALSHGLGRLAQDVLGEDGDDDLAPGVRRQRAQELGQLAQHRVATGLGAPGAESEPCTAKGAVGGQTGKRGQVGRRGARRRGSRRHVSDAPRLGPAVVLGPASRKRESGGPPRRRYESAESVLRSVQPIRGSSRISHVPAPAAAASARTAGAGRP